MSGIKGLDIETFLPALVEKRQAIQALNKEFEALVQVAYREARLSGLGPHGATAFVSKLRRRVNEDAKHGFTPRPVEVLPRPSDVEQQA